jgi:hypothetical protein
MVLVATLANKNAIQDLDIFLGRLNAQILKTKSLRMNAVKFFELVNDKYNDLTTSSPNLSTVWSMGAAPHRSLATCIS